MSGRIPKSQVPVKSQSSLPYNAGRALIDAKNRIKSGGVLRRFQNSGGNSPGEGPPLPTLDSGCSYYEFDVGSAHANDPQGLRGVRRLVIELNDKSREIREIYYTEAHYGKFTFVRVV